VGAALWARLCGHFYRVFWREEIFGNDFLDLPADGTRAIIID
jgi:hypothetical protein